MESKSIDQSEMPHWLRGSEMGELIFIHDWTASGLGPIQAWPPHLQLAVNIILLLPSAAILLWGSNLIQIYNDRFRDLMGAKHPMGFGQMASECWPEAWNFVGPVCEAVMRRGESLIFDEQRLILNRNGGPEEAFFKLTYSPVPGGMPGDVPAAMAGGVLVTVNETTELVHARAREAERIQLKEAMQAKRIELLEGIFRNAPSFLYVLKGPKFVFECVNDAFYKLVGHRELIGRPAFEALPELAECGARENLIKVMATGEPFAGFELPVTVIRKPGEAPEERLIDVVYLPLVDEEGARQRVLGHGIDVTTRVQERKDAEEALRTSEERFRRTLELDTVGFVFFNRKGDVTGANDAFLKMSGLGSANARAGLLHGDVETPVEWTEILLQAAADFEMGDAVAPHEQEFLRSDGSRWWALITAKQLDKEEAIAYVIDITKRKRAEQALRESEARFRAMSEASPALTWQVDAQGNVVYLNQRYMDMVGMNMEQLAPSGWRSILHPEDAPAYLTAFEQALRECARFQHRVRIRTAKNEWHWLRSYALPWFTVEGEYAGHVGVSVDITEAVNAETALLEADRRKDEFLATLAHELRNPLAPISNSLALMARPDGVPAIPHLLPIISRQVNYMVRLVDDLLEISRITSGKVELRRAPTDLSLVLRNAIDASLPLIDENKHKLGVCISSEPPMTVYADSVRLEQIFTNLLNNAARYTRKGGQIWLTAHPENNNAVISVRDNGIGILPGMLPRLFDMFAQERRNGVGTQEGLGIGLNLVYRLVKMHGGTVEAKSEGKDRGSEFVVRLPLSEVIAPDRNAEPEKVEPVEPEGLRVLVVDDNHDAAEVLRMLLESGGFNAEAVTSGAEALAALPIYRPDVILMDIGMPGMSGHDVARRIREQPQFDDITLVALTGWGQEEDRRESKASGFDHHLTKPVNFNVLKELLATI